MPDRNQSRQLHRDGLLFVGHGTRDAAGIAEFFAAAELVRKAAAGRPLEACFLELAPPTIGEGVDRLVSQGTERIVVVPLLLFAAGHAKRDIPVAVAEAAARHRGLAVFQIPALECSRHILALSERRFQEAIADWPPVPPEETLLLMVGRGSTDAEATAEMHRFARLRAEQTLVGRMLTCFVAMQTPSLAEGLTEAAAGGFRRIVVQPHLLFNGELSHEIRHEVERRSGDAIRLGTEPIGRQSACQWIVTSPLGPEPELATAVMELVGHLLLPLP
ncbi:MAG TPA: sirohydrochlorin chelatase [Pirellulales bacterium]|jgi:sirohydrochlorin ferrochelatase|nr:sirohydrochlorin chelatase [Pirellulales bacterium]